ncbi:MAG TPA: MmoB/DmpM family protein [Nannocystaceae bacterium]|nr:MmoB/DmpM family protein [Nannocystaceae bacterium]
MTAADARVGPVLVDGDASRAVIAAIRELNTDVSVHDRGAYLRVEVPGRCVVTRAAIERVMGRPFQLPGDLECIMPSFKGELSIAGDIATWEVRR